MTLTEFLVGLLRAAVEIVRVAVAVLVWLVMAAAIGGFIRFFRWVRSSGHRARAARDEIAGSIGGPSFGDSKTAPTSIQPKAPPTRGQREVKERDE
ncbi:MAG: hypothetical protein ACE5PT_12310 [Gemmatimonadales bacterium]